MVQMGNKLDTQPQNNAQKRSGYLTQRAAELIRLMVKDGQLRSGDRVNELDLATRLGMSRGPVREAVRRLSSSGLLVEEPNIGARVVSLSPEYIGELYLVRELLESQAAAEAAQVMTEEECRGVQDLLDRHQRQLDDGRSNEYSMSPEDWDFHRLVLQGSRNRLITRICGNDLRDAFLLLRARYGRRSARGHQALREHRQIADAILAKNPEVAAVLMRQHIRASRDAFLEFMRLSADHAGADLPASPVVGEAAPAGGHANK